MEMPRLNADATVDDVRSALDEADCAVLEDEANLDARVF